MNYLKLSILVSFLFLVGCSDSQEEPEAATKEEQGPPFSEYMTCTPGTGFNDNTARMMVDEWNDLALDESLFYAAGHAPLLEESLGGEGKVYWQLFWDSKEAADAAWASGPSEEFAAWAEKHQSVLTCDGENRRGYDAYFPNGDNDNWGEPSVQWVTYGHYCKFNDEDGLEKLKEGVEAFNAYLDNQGDDVAPYRYAVYMHNGDNPEPYASYDFFWMNYYKNHDDAQTSYERFANEGANVQAMFDASATCEGPNASDSYQFFPDPDDV